jgi:mannan polymerase complexes MNN9 subunit
LLSHALEATHDYVLWIDADIIHLPHDLIDSFVASGAMIATPLCVRAGSNYDLNAWSGPRIRPSPAEKEIIRSGGLFVPRPVPGITQHLDRIPKPKAVVPGPTARAPITVALDSVGGTVLWVHADVHRQGAIFPHYHVIGTDWDDHNTASGAGHGPSQHNSHSGDGYDGIETEGLCWSAKRLLGSHVLCYGLPDITVVHDSS